MNLDRLNPSRRTRTATGTTGAVDTADAGTPFRRTRHLPTDETATGSVRAPRDRAVTDERELADHPGTRRDVLEDDTDERETLDRDVSGRRTGAVAVDTTDEPAVLDRRTVIARERDEFGGVKIGSAFFGWLTATGTAVLLTALVAAGGTALGVLNGNSVSNPDFGVTWRGTRGAVMIVAILLVAYFCGGYVAGRMARFNGVTQGLAVFAWAVVIALVVAALAAVAGTQWNALSAVTGVPRFGHAATRLTADGALVGLLAVAAALAGSVLGGLAGMRFHRRVDRAGLGR